MTDAPPPPEPPFESDPPPDPSSDLSSLPSDESPRRFLGCLPKWLIVVGASLTLATAGAAGVTTYWVKTRLSPLVARSLTTLLDRPVEIGAVSGFGLTSVRFEASKLPAIEGDLSFAQVPSVTANFNPLQVLGGALDLNVTLESPTVTLIQADSGRWLALQFQPQPSEGGLKIQLDTLEIAGGKVNLVPFPEPAPSATADVNTGENVPPDDAPDSGLDSTPGNTPGNLPNEESDGSAVPGGTTPPRSPSPPPQPPATDSPFDDRPFTEPDTPLDTPPAQSQTPSHFRLARMGWPGAEPGSNRQDTQREAQYAQASEPPNADPTDSAAPLSGLNLDSFTLASPGGRVPELTPGSESPARLEPPASLDPAGLLQIDPDVLAPDTTSSNVTNPDATRPADADATTDITPEAASPAIPELEDGEPPRPARSRTTDPSGDDTTRNDATDDTKNNTADDAIEIIKAPNAVDLPPLDTLPEPPTSLRVFDVEGEVRVEAGGDRVAFESIGKNGQFGRLDVRGEIETTSGAIALNVAAQNVAGEALTTALPMPFDLYGGRLFANLDLGLDINDLGAIPLMAGTARATDVLVALDGAPQPIFAEKTNLAFRERQVALEGMRGQYGPLPLQIDRGLIDLEQGYELPVLVPPVDWRVVRQAVLPEFTIDGFGEVEAQLIVRGALEEPILVGRFASTSPLEVDRLAFSDLAGQFGFAVTQGEFVLEQLNAVPTSGGALQAAMQLKLPPDDTTSVEALVEFALAEVNVDAIAVDYGASLPIDRVSAQGRITLQNDVIGIAIPQIQVGKGLGQVLAEIRGDRWQGEVALSNIQLDPSLTPVNLGAFNGRAQLAGNLDFFTAPDLSKIALQTVGETRVNGQPVAFGVQLGNGQWRVESQVENFPVTALTALPNPVSQLNIGGFSGVVVAEGMTTGLQLVPQRLGGNGQLPVEGGVVAGNLTLDGGLDNGQWRVESQFENLPVDPLVALPPPVSGLDFGAVSGMAIVEGITRQSQFLPTQVVGNGQLAVGGGQVAAAVSLDGGLNNGQWRVESQFENLPVTPLVALPKSLLRLGIGNASGVAIAEGRTRRSQFIPTQLGGSGRLAIGGGTVAGNIAINGGLDNGQWRVESQFENLPVTPLVALPDPLALLDFGALSGLATAEGILRRSQFVPTQVDGSGQLAVEGGTIAGNVSLVGDRWSSQMAIRDVGLAKLLPANLPLRSPRFSSPQLNLAGTTAFDLATTQAQGAVVIGAENGGVAGELTLQDTAWTVNLAQFSLPVPDPWRGLFPTIISANTSSQLSGSVFDLSPSAIVGRIGAALPSPALAPNYSESGTPTGGIAVELGLDRDHWEARVAVPPQDLATLLSSAAIAELTDTTTPDIGGQVAAELALTGGWSGLMPTNIELADGGLQLENLTLNGETVSNKLEGPIVRGALPRTEGSTPFPLVEARYGELPEFEAAVVANDISIALVEPIDPDNPPDDPNAIDRVVVQLSQDYWPRLLEVKLGEVRGAGRCTIANRDRPDCEVIVDGFPLNWLGLEPVAGRGQVTGTLGFDGRLDPVARSFTGDVRWLDARWGAVAADAIVGTVGLRDRQLGVDELVVVRDDTEYEFNGTVNLVDNPELGIKVSVENGDLQDLLELLQWSELEDISRGFAPVELGDAADLDAVAVGDPTRSILDRVRRLIEIDLLREQREQQTIGRLPLPDLRDLAGQYSATIDLNGTRAEPVVDFEVAGADWQWEPYAMSELQLSGRYRDRQLELDPSWLSVRLDPDAPDSLTRLDLSGLLSPDVQAATVELADVPLSFIGEAAKFPSQFQTSGFVDLSATLAGTQADPLLRGTLSLSEGTLNSTPIALERSGFFYEDGRVRFGGDVFTVSSGAVESPVESSAESLDRTDTTAVTIRGTSPFALPGATVLNPDPQFSVTIETRDNGMAFLNALTDSVAWIGGGGEANITLSGRQRNGIYTVEETTGTALFNGAILRSPQLPEPLTDVRGRIDLDGDRLIVNDVVGKFEQGAVKTAGTLSLFNPFAADSQLTVVLEQADLNLKRIYSGGIDGRIEITGAALLPKIGGYLSLSNGLVFLDPNATAIAPPALGTTPVIRYNDLQIRLEDNIRLVSPPTLDFVADGRLTLSGLLDNPVPAGKIFLRDGRVNLFTTAFTLDRNRFNTAIFAPEFGRDPILNIRMGAAATQTTRSRIVSSLDVVDANRSPELQDVAIERGGVETIRISATVQGRASQLFDRLELSSTPARPELELYALLGGGISENTEGGGTVAIASSALLTQIQSVVSRALGLRDFRLFPAFDPRTSTLGLGAEVGVRLSDRLSSSFQVILDRDDTFRFSTRYRINDDLVLLGSTDFGDDHRGAIEFQTRF